MAPSGTRAASGSDTASPDAQTLPSCVTGLDSTAEGRIQIAKNDPEAVPKTDADCASADATIVDLLRISPLTKQARSEYRTALGVANVWADLHATCKHWQAISASGTSVASDFDDLVRFYRSMKTLPVGARPLLESLRVSAVLGSHASHDICPEFAEQFTSWAAKERLPLWQITLSGYRFQ